MARNELSFHAGYAEVYEDASSSAGSIIRQAPEAGPTVVDSPAANSLRYAQLLSSRLRDQVQLGSREVSMFWHSRAAAKASLSSCVNLARLYLEKSSKW